MSSVIWLGCYVVMPFAVMGFERLYDMLRLWRSNRRYGIKQRYEPYRRM